MPRSLAPWLCGILTVAIGSTALAFDPPIDRAGPLVVRIEGPKEVTQPGVKIPIRVVLENQGAAPLKGTVTLGLIDRWTATPAGAVEFSVGGKATASREFTAVAGTGTYSALYPIHAVATFVSEGKTLTAHPVLIVETKLGEAPRTNDAPQWKPWPVAQAGQPALWSLPSRRALI